MRAVRSRLWMTLMVVVGLTVVTACGGTESAGKGVAAPSAFPTAGSFVVPPPSAAPAVSVVPAPSADLPTDTPDASRSETVVLAGGCFWGVQGVFEHVKGVSRAESGYAGGSAATADYETVSTGTSGHAESVQVTFDPGQVSLGQILQIFFSVAHDPTELDRQGPDTGSQYRSAIFAQNAEQQAVAEAYVRQLTEQKVFANPIVTRISFDTDFYPAEAHHQDFLNSNPDYPYIVINDLPKLDQLKVLFPQLYTATPVLVSAGS